MEFSLVLLTVAFSAKQIYQVFYVCFPNGSIDIKCIYLRSVITISQMSIYSGFATRFQQQAYDHCIDSLLYVLQKRIIKFYQGEPAQEEKFISVVLKLHQQMRNMEKSKYLDPKSSQSVNELVKFMQLYQHNLVTASQQDNSVHPETDSLQAVEPVQSKDEGSVESKKVTFWVQKVPKNEGSVHNLQKAQSGMVPIPEKPKQSSQQKKVAEFRRTTYHNGSIRGMRVKNTSRTNLSRDREQIGQIVPLRVEKNRSISGHLQQKPVVLQSKVSYSNYGEEGSAVRRRKLRSTSKVGLEGAVGVRNEVADIIREYIMKSKRNKAVSRHSRQNMEYLGRLNDF